jgi:AcrR family transcriptional regulator
VTRLRFVADVKPSRRDINAGLTRAAVLDAARALFVAKGFEATSIDEIAISSSSSKGAIYHHFQNKQAIFAEVFRASQAAIMQAVLPAALESMPADADPWDQALLAISAVLRCYVDDDDARILLRESAGALGWDRKQAVDEELALPLLRAVLTELIDGGQMMPVPVSITAELLYALLSKTGPIIAASEDPAQAVTEIEPVLFRMLNGLHRDSGTSQHNKRLGFAGPPKTT